MNIRMRVVVYMPMHDDDTIEEAEDRMLDVLEEAGFRVAMYDGVEVVD